MIQSIMPPRWTSSKNSGHWAQGRYLVNEHIDVLGGWGTLTPWGGGGHRSSACETLPDLVCLLWLVPICPLVMLQHFLRGSSELSNLRGLWNADFVASWSEVRVTGGPPELTAGICSEVVVLGTVASDTSSGRRASEWYCSAPASVRTSLFAFLWQTMSIPHPCRLGPCQMSPAALVRQFPCTLVASFLKHLLSQDGEG